MSSDAEVTPAATAVIGGVPLPVLTGRLGRAATYSAIAWKAYKAADKFRKSRIDKRLYYVSVTSRDTLFREVRLWLVELSGEAAMPQTVLVESFDGGGGVVELPAVPPSNAEFAATQSGTASPGGINIVFDDTAEQHIRLGEHEITAKLVKPDFNKDIAYYDMIEKVQFTCPSEAARDAVLEHLRKMATEKSIRRPALYVWNRSYFSKRNDLPTRKLEDVVLAAGQLERIRDDITNFISSEPAYAKHGLPYHRGILLSGPPGTGKTSLARALGSYFNMDVYYAPLGDIGKDVELLSMVSEVSPRSILLLEDIDVFSASRSREEVTGHATLAGLLNSLDGVATPHGLITIMTSNERSVLDPALIRPGRIDLDETLGLLDAGQAGRLFKSFYGHYDIRAELASGSSPAAVLEVFKRHMDDPESAVETLLSEAWQNHGMTQPANMQ